MPERIPPTGPTGARQVQDIEPAFLQSQGTKGSLKQAAILSALATDLDHGAILATPSTYRFPPRTPSGLLGGVGAHQPPATAGRPGSTPSSAAPPSGAPPKAAPPSAPYAAAPGSGLGSSLDDITAFYKSLVGLSAAPANGADPHDLIANILKTLGSLDLNSSDPAVKAALAAFLDPSSGTSQNEVANTFAFALVLNYSWDDIQNGTWLNDPNIPSTLKTYLEPSQDTIEKWVNTTFVSSKDTFNAQKGAFQQAAVSQFLFAASAPGSTLAGVSIAQLQSHFEGGITSPFSNNTLFGLIDKANSILDPAAVRGSVLSEMDSMADSITSVLKEIMPPTPDTGSPDLDSNKFVQDTNKLQTKPPNWDPLHQFKINWPGFDNSENNKDPNYPATQGAYNTQCWKALASTLSTIYAATASTPGPLEGPAAVSTSSQSFTITWPNGKTYTIPPIATFLPPGADNATDTAKLKSALADFHQALGSIKVYDERGDRDKNTGRPTNQMTLADLFQAKTGSDAIADDLSFTLQAADQKATTSGSPDVYTTDPLASSCASGLTGLIPVLTNFSSSAQNAVQTLGSVSQSAWQQFIAAVQSMISTKSTILNSISKMTGNQ